MAEDSNGVNLLNVLITSIAKKKKAVKHFLLCSKRSTPLAPQKKKKRKSKTGASTISNYPHPQPSYSRNHLSIIPYLPNSVTYLYALSVWCLYKGSRVLFMCNGVYKWLSFLWVCDCTSMSLLIVSSYVWNCASGYAYLLHLCRHVSLIDMRGRKWKRKRKEWMGNRERE